MDSFYQELSNKMEKHIPKLTIFTLSNDIQYDYTRLFKTYINEIPDVELVIKLNKYFKCGNFTKFLQD